MLPKVGPRLHFDWAQRGNLVVTPVCAGQHRAILRQRRNAILCGGRPPAGWAGARLMPDRSRRCPRHIRNISVLRTNQRRYILLAFPSTPLSHHRARIVRTGATRTAPVGLEFPVRRACRLPSDAIARSLESWCTLSTRGGHGTFRRPASPEQRLAGMQAGETHSRKRDRPTGCYIPAHGYTKKSRTRGVRRGVPLSRSRGGS